MSRFKSLRFEIISIYREDERVADNDKMLIAYVWARHGWESSDNLYENLKRVPSAESIRRTRQKLVAEGIIKTSDNAREMRYNAFKEYRKEFSDGNI